MTWRPGLHATALSGASQVVGLGQIGLLLRGTGGTAATDAYFFLFSASLLPSQILLAGVAYPVLLNNGGSRGQAMWRLRRFAPLASVACLAIAAMVLSYRHADYEPTALVLILAANGVVLTILWFDCLSLAADGEASWLAGIALPANVAACLALIIARGEASRVEVMAVGLVVGNLLYLIFLRRSSLAPRHVYFVGVDSVRGSGYGWYLMKAAAGYGSGTLVQGFALALPVSSVTTISVITKVVGAAITTIVSPVLPRLVNTGSETDRPAEAYSRRLLVPLLAAQLAVLTLALASGKQPVFALALGIGWAIAGIANAVSQRVAYRFLPPSTALLSIAALVTVTAGLAALAGVGRLTVALLLLGSVGIEAVGGLLMARAIGWSWMKVLLVTVLVASGAGAIGA